MVQHGRSRRGRDEPHVTESADTAVAALECPVCGLLGTIVRNDGPAASTEDAEVLLRLDRAPPPKEGISGSS